MAEVVVFHHIQGLTDGVREFADRLRAAGHTVHTPDLFYGRTFGSIEEGFAFAQGQGMEGLHARGVASVAGLGSRLVYAGFSFGAAVAQDLAQTRPGAAGAVLMCACMPVAEFSPAWPGGVPVQVHGMEGDEFFEEDLPAARELVAAAADADLFVYPGGRHLFPDSSLDAYDPDATELLMQRVLEFLARV